MIKTFSDSVIIPYQCEFDTESDFRLKFAFYIAEYLVQNLEIKKEHVDLGTRYSAWAMVTDEDGFNKIKKQMHKEVQNG